MRVLITRTSAKNQWLPMVEQACADAVDQDRQDAFLYACLAEGLSVKHPVVRTLAGDLTRIRPPDVWLRIIAAHLPGAQRTNFPLKALDHGLSSLRLADAYVIRDNADAEVATRLLAAVVRQMPYPAVERWRHWHADRDRAASDDADVFTLCSDAGRYAPLSMVTVVSSQFGNWAAPFTPLVENLGALEYCGSEIVRLRRGHTRNRGLSVLETLIDKDNAAIELALNNFAENVYTNWQSVKNSISPSWLPLLQNKIEAAIQFAAIAVELMNYPANE